MGQACSCENRDGFNFCERRAPETCVVIPVDDVDVAGRNHDEKLPDLQPDDASGSRTHPCLSNVVPGIQDGTDPVAPVRTMQSVSSILTSAAVASSSPSHATSGHTLASPVSAAPSRWSTDVNAGVLLRDEEEPHSGLVRASTLLSGDEVRAGKSHFLDETVDMAVLGSFPSNDHTRGKSLGWRNISKPSATVWCRTRNVSKVVRDTIYLNIKSPDQVPSLPLLTMKDNRIHDGAIPTLWAVQFWNLWFPFCESCEILRRFSPSCFIAIVKLKVMFLVVDFITFVSLEDKLSTDGYIELVMRSPPSGSEGTEWMGITVPPRAGILPRVCIIFALVKAIPTSLESLEMECQIEVEDPAGAPQWLKVFFFQQLSIRVVPEIFKFQKKFPGSTLDKFFNEKGAKSCDAESLMFIQQLYKSITEFVQGRE